MTERVYHCSECARPIPQDKITEWLWMYNGLPDKLQCSMACAKKAEAGEVN